MTLTFYEEYKKGHLIIPTAMLENFSQIFESADDFLVWQFFLYEKEMAPSYIAEKTGKSLSEVNSIIQKMQDSGVLKVTLLEISGQVDMIFDVAPAFEKLDDLIVPKSKNQENKKQTSENKLQSLSNAFEAEMGMITPIQLEELRNWLEVDQYDFDLILAALREASINRKVSLNYIRAILRRWRTDGINSVRDVEAQREERDLAMQIQKGNIGNTGSSANYTIPIEGPWSQNK
ncbi:MAG: DnaD domain-containing protein [Streptococcaceae bacterium]|jgi:DNA replication protein|nr:DnaD domain-containing protein [Streptococcaceae bacterium]